MTDSKEEIVRQTVRLPKRVYDAIEAARGTPGKPRPSFHETMLYLILEGLRATGQGIVEETEPGNWLPALHRPIYALV